MSLIPTWPIAAGALVAGLAAGGFGAKLWYADTIADLKIAAAETKRDEANAISQASQAALEDYKEAATVIKAAAGGAQIDVTKLGVKLDAIDRRYKNAKPAPLDPGCRPGPVRLYNLSEAAAAVDAATARPVTGR